MTATMPTTIDRSAAAPERAAARGGFVAELRGMALRSLTRMYRPEERQFVFCLRRTPHGIRPEGLSRRYTAITLIGLAGEDPAVVTAVLGAHDLDAACSRLIADLPAATNLGDVALTAWAARAVGHPLRDRAVARLVELHPQDGARPTVEVAWALTALSLDPDAGQDGLRDQLARRLVAAFAANVFPHVIGQAGARSHVCCFADLVYPIQALAHYSRATGDRPALDAAVACAEHICRLQGPDGQWWWHYDVRTGRVVEGYPVYAVHQDAMAPMALFAAADVSGVDFGPSIARGLDWLARSPELGGGSLVDREADLIWRKVARREPGKLARYAQAIASRAHPGLRVPALDTLLPPGAVDFEDRPYHLGWLLHAFPVERAARW